MTGVNRAQLELIKNPAGPFDRSRLEITPDALYIAGLAPEAKQTMRRVLKRAAAMMAAPYPLLSTDQVRWELLRFGHLELLKEKMSLRNLAPSTINTMLCALRGVAREAWRLKLMEDEDYHRVKDVRGVRGSRARAGRRLAYNELAALIEECEEDKRPGGARDLCLVAIIAGGGLRRAEAVALDLDSWDAARHELKVKGKGNKERVVFFDDGEARRAISRWLRVRGSKEGPLLCPVDKRGRVSLRRLSTNAVYNALAKRGAAAGLSHFSPHDLRRTFGSDFLDLLGDTSAVRDLLGHADVRTTQRYDLRGEEARREWMGFRPLPFRLRRKRTPKRAKKSRRRKFRRGEFK